MQDFQKHMTINTKFGKLFNHLVCNDGFKMSVQGSEYNYCNPRIDSSNASHYYEMEIGFPSEREELIIQYAEQPEIPTDTVYGYVPVELIQRVIDKHGGLKE